jgi:YbbR domain-containing protein
MAYHPFRNFGLKVVALGLGTLLWFTVSGQQADRTVTGVPVVYRNKSAALEIIDQTELVDIHVRGLDSQLRAAQPRDFEARVDLAGARAGLQTIVLRTDQVSAPFGLEVTQVDPGSVTALLELSGAATVPVRPSVEGLPAAGFMVSQVTPDPAVDTGVGPARRKAGTTAATTDRISIDGARESVTQTVSVGVVDSLLRLRESTTARVVVTIEPAGERQFAALRVGVRNAGPGLRGTVEPASVVVLLRGPQALLARLDSRAIGPYVDVTGLGPGRHEGLPVLFDLSARLSLAWVRPATVTVTIN